MALHENPGFSEFDDSTYRGIKRPGEEADGREVADNSKTQKAEEKPPTRALGPTLENQILAGTESDKRDADKLLAGVDNPDATWPPIASVDTKSTQAHVNVGGTEGGQGHETHSA